MKKLTVALSVLSGLRLLAADFGAAYYLASVPDENRMLPLMKKVLAVAKIDATEELPKEISHGRRGDYDIYVNQSDKTVEMPVVVGQLVLGEPKVVQSKWQLPACGVVVVRRCCG